MLHVLLRGADETVVASSFSMDSPVLQETVLDTYSSCQTEVCALVFLVLEDIGFVDRTRFLDHGIIDRTLVLSGSPVTGIDTGIDEAAHFLSSETEVRHHGQLYIGVVNDVVRTGIDARTTETIVAL